MTPTQFHLRYAVASDLDAVLTLERATDLAPHWPPAAYAEILESTDPGAPSMSRLLRNGWVTSSPTSEQIDSDAYRAASTTQRCLYVAEKNGLIAGFAVGLLHPGAPFIPRSLRNGWETTSQSSGRNHIHESTDASARQCIAELESVVVSAGARRTGIGRALCRAVLDWSRFRGASEVILEVRANSTAAVALYTSFGFTLTARRSRYYQDPEDDALLLRLALQ